MRRTHPSPSPLTTRRVATRKNVATSLVAGLALLLVAAPVWAHPLGLPATARIVRTADAEVVVRWAAQPDDVVALAVAAGLREVDGEVPADASLTTGEDAALAASDALRDLVLDQVTVTTADGTACDADLRQQPTVAVHGLEVVFDCAQSAAEVSVTIGLLHDLDPRYRTFAAATTADGEAQAMFSGTRPTHQFTLVEVGTAGADEVGPGDENAADATGATDQSPPWISSTAIADGFVGFGAGWFDGAFLAAIDRPAGVTASVLGLLVALAVGAVHALAPGHGKAIAAAYLVGDHGRRRDAVVLGSTVALMHTGSVLLLGFALFSATRAPDAARLGASIEAVAGGTFVALGGWLLWRRWRARSDHHHAAHDSHDLGDTHDGGAPRDAHDHGAHDHGAHDPDAHDPDAHDHGAHGHSAHDRGPAADVDPDASHLQRVVALGAAGGLLPSPSALLVLLTALAIGRLTYGLALVGAFSVGLAATLTLVGLAVLSGRDLAQRRLPARFHGWLHAAPLLGAVVVVALGGVVLVRALLRLA